MYGSKPKEKDVYMPWGSVKVFWNPETEKYEELDPAQFKPKKKKGTPYRPPPRKPFEQPTIFDKRPRRSEPAGNNKKRTHDDMERPRSLGKHPHVYNPEHSTYECLNFDERGVYDHAASSGKSDMPPPRGQGWYGRVEGPPVTHRPKNAGIPDDDPSVMFKGMPLALAIREKEAFQRRFPGLTPAELVAKKRELDAAEARETKAKANEKEKRKKVDEEEKKKRILQASEKDAATQPSRGKRPPPTSMNADHLPKDPISRMMARAKPRVIRKVKAKK